MRSGSAVVDERFLSQTSFKELVVSFFGVSVYGGGDILNVGHREDGQAGEIKLFSRVKWTVSCC